MLSEFDQLLTDADAEICAAMGVPALCICEDGEQFTANVIISEGVENFTPAGDIRGPEIHAEMQKPSLCFGVGGIIRLPDSWYRVDRTLTDDGLMVTYLVAPLADHDHEQLQKVQAPLRRIVHEAW